MGDAGEPRLGLVLVHGFRSGPDMWDELRTCLARDPALGFVDVLPFGYATKLWKLRPLSRIPSFTMVADSLKEFLDTEAEAYDRLMVVTHSQGGLALQRYLVRMTGEGRGRDLRRIRRVVLLACPNAGSQLALSLRRRVIRGGNPQERQLRPLNEEVAEVQRAVLRDVVYAGELTARTCPIPFSVYAGESDGVVTPAAARNTFPDAAVLPGTHFTIARPKGPDDRTFTTLRRLMLLARTEVLPGDPGAGDAGQAGNPAGQAGDGEAGDAGGSAGSVAGHTPPAGAAVAPAAAVPVVASPAGPPPRATGFPDVLAVAAAVERVHGMDDPEVRRMLIRLVANDVRGFSPASSNRTRDHLVEIVTACREHEDPRAALLALRDAVTWLRPGQGPTLRLRALVDEAVSTMDAGAGAGETAG